MTPIEDHGLLTYLYFVVPEIADALVDVEHRTSRVLLRIHKPETARDRAFPEQPLAGTQNNGKLPDTERIDEISAVAILSAGSVEFGHEPAKILLGLLDAGRFL